LLDLLYLLYPGRGGVALSLPLHWAHAPHGDYNKHVGCSMERGRHGGKAEKGEGLGTMFKVVGAMEMGGGLFQVHLREVPLTVAVFK
jgi:hypothetical protein